MEKENGDNWLTQNHLETGNENGVWNQLFYKLFRVGKQDCINDIQMLMFTVHGIRCPVYLSESVQSVSSNPVCQRLRSASSLNYIVPRRRTKFGERAFAVAGPTEWNSLPESVRSAETPSSFKRKLKTHLFNILF